MYRIGAKCDLGNRWRTHFVVELRTIYPTLPIMSYYGCERARLGHVAKAVQQRIHRRSKPYTAELYSAL